MDMMDKSSQIVLQQPSDYLTNEPLVVRVYLLESCVCSTLCWLSATIEINYLSHKVYKFGTIIYVARKNLLLTIR